MTKPFAAPEPIPAETNSAPAQHVTATTDNDMPTTGGSYTRDASGALVPTATAKPDPIKE